MKKNLKGTIKELLYNTPYLKQNFLELGKLGLYKTWVPLGHFYSPIPSLTEIKSKEDEIFSKHLTKNFLELI